MREAWRCSLSIRHVDGDATSLFAEEHLSGNNPICGNLHKSSYISVFMRYMLNRANFSEIDIRFVDECYVVAKLKKSGGGEGRGVVEW